MLDRVAQWSSLSVARDIHSFTAYYVVESCFLHNTALSHRCYSALNLEISCVASMASSVGRIQANLLEQKSNRTSSVCSNRVCLFHGELTAVLLTAVAHIPDDLGSVDTLSCSRLPDAAPATCPQSASPSYIPGKHAITAQATVAASDSSRSTSIMFVDLSVAAAACGVELTNCGAVVSGVSNCTSTACLPMLPELSSATASRCNEAPQGRIDTRRWVRSPAESWRTESVSGAMCICSATSSAVLPTSLRAILWRSESLSVFNEAAAAEVEAFCADCADACQAVSYTHLTLPTKA